MIYFKQNTCICAFILMVFLFPGGSGHIFAQRANQKSLSKSEDKTLVQTLILDLKRVNCSDDITSMVNDGIRARLKRIPHCYPVPDDEIKSKGIEGLSTCHDRECAVKYAKQLDCKKAIIGSLIRVTKSKKEQLGEEGEFKYIYEVKPYDEFVIKIDLIDINSGSVEVDFREKAKKNEINAKLDLLPAKFGRYFEPLLPPVPPHLTPWIGVSPSCIIPLSKFSRIIGVAGGVTLDVGLKHIVIPNIYAKISGSYYFLAKKKKSVRSYQSGQLSVLGGYSFPLPKGFSITPMIGVGYQFHVIKDFQYTIPYLLGRTIRTNYYDFLITIRCEGAYSVYKDLYVTLTPGYTIFFEKGQTGHYINIDAGVKYEFDIKTLPIQ